VIRAFVAIEIPGTVELGNLLDRLRKSGSQVSVPRAENVHVTMKFLGDVQEDRVGSIMGAIAEATSGFASFEAKIVGTGAFPGPRNPRVLWVGIEDGGAMGRIADAIDERISALGFERERRAFTPHITIARVKSQAGIDRGLSISREYEKVDFGTFSVSDVRLKKSTLTPSGPIYEDLGVIQLRARDTPRE